MARAARGALALLARRAPAPTYAGVALLAKATARPSTVRDTADRLQVVFPTMSRADATRAAREVRASTWRAATLGEVLMRGGRPVYPAYRCSEVPAAALEGPVIFLTFHGCAVGVIGDALRVVPREILALHRTHWKMPRNIEGLFVGPDEASHTAAFHQAVRARRRGASVMLAADGPGHPVPLLGRQGSLRRGPYALARLTDTPIVPVLAWWRGATVEVTFEEPIAAGPDEAAMALQAAAVLERHLLAHPGQIYPETLLDLTR